MKIYKVKAWNEEGIRVQESDFHTWAECEAIYHDYMERDDTESVSIIYIGEV